MRRFFLSAVGSVLGLLALVSSAPAQTQPGAAPKGKLRVLAVARRPLAGKDIPGGGLIVALLAAGLRQSGVPDFAGVDLDVQWTTSPIPPFPRSPSIDVALPVDEPGCGHPNNLTPSLAAFCDNAVFSKPMLQVVVGLFAPRNGGFTFDSDEKIFEKTICAAQDHDVSTLDSDGRDWVSLKRITVLRRQTPVECVAAVQGRIAHAFAATDLEGRHLLGNLGLTEAFRMQAHPLAARGIHAIAARGDARGSQIIDALNRGLERLKQGDQYATMVQTHLIKLWDGSANAPPLQAPVERAMKSGPPIDKERALGFMKKGEELMATGNVEAARLFYRRAADAGLAQGALALAATFDPQELARRQVVGGLRPDPAEAQRWYERARELGAAEAEGPLKRLGARR